MNALSARFPRTVERLLALGDGARTLDHLVSLEEAWAQRREPRPQVATTPGPDAGAHPDYDVILAGGGLSLVYGAYLAHRGLRVAIFDKRRIAVGHREWNISRKELAPLRDSGLFSDAELAELLVMEYDHGICRWHGGGTWPVRGVLDGVVDAGRLLSSLRTRAEAASATLLDHHALVGYAVGASGVTVELDGPDGRRTLTGRVLVDGLGAASPHAAFDLCCPTVGGVLLDLDQGQGALQVDPQVGEILVTTEGLEEDRQHIWEGFPGPGGRFTTYLFYYAEPQQLPPHPLLSLYERFFQTLPRYKSGPARLEKATYGFIPAYTRLRPMPVAPTARVLLVGDAAGRHSPLTFCGFGSMIRSFLPVADRLRACLADERLGQRDLERCWQEPSSLQVMGGLTLMMVGGRGAKGARDPSDVNRLLDVAFGTLAELGNDVYGNFVRDEIGFVDFMRFMRRTAALRPSIYDEVFAQLSTGEIARWVWRLGKLGLQKWR